MCDLGFLRFDLGFEVGFWKVFGRILGVEKGWFCLGFLGFLGVVLVGDSKDFLEDFLG